MSSRKEIRKEKKKAKKEKRAAEWASYTKLDKQHLVYIGIMAVLAVTLLFWGGSAYTAEPETEATKAPEVSTTVPTTTQPTTNKAPTVSPTEPAKPDEPTENNGKEEATQKNDTSESKEEILKKVVDGVNSLKASDASFKGTKDQYIDIKLTDCSVPQFTGIINGVLERFLGEEKLEYDFTNGVSENPEGGDDITSMEAIPPSFIEFGLTADGVTNAYVTKDGENTVYTVEVVAEEDIFPPVRYPDCATCKMFSFCAPVGASFPALTVAFVVSDEVVFFVVYADENLRFDILVYKLYTFVFNDFHASCVHCSFVCSFLYLSFL